MLVLSRKLREGILIGNDIEVVVTRIEDGKVRIAISAPPDVLVVRSELRDQAEDLRKKFVVERSLDQDSKGIFTDEEPSRLA